MVIKNLKPYHCSFCGRRIFGRFPMANYERYYPYCGWNCKELGTVLWAEQWCDLYLNVEVKYEINR